MDVATSSLMLRLAPLTSDARDALTTGAAGLDTIPVAQIRTLQVYRPNSASLRARSAVGWGMLGAGGGAVVGLVAVAAIGASSSGGGSGGEPLLGALFGMAGGSVIGALYGASHPSPWQTVRLPDPERERR